MNTKTIEFSSTAWGTPEDTKQILLDGSKDLTVRRTEYEDGYYHLYLDNGEIVAEANLKKLGTFILKFRGKNFRAWADGKEMNYEQLDEFRLREGMTQEQFTNYYWEKTNQGTNTYVGAVYKIELIRAETII